MNESNPNKLLIVIIIGVIITFVGYYPAMCWMHDTSEPSGAISFAYERMCDKTNVTFISKSFIYGDGMYFYVVDSGGEWWRIQWSNIYNNIKMNTSYDIRYQDFPNTMSDNIWEIKENKTVNYV